MPRSLQTPSLPSCLDSGSQDPPGSADPRLRPLLSLLPGPLPSPPHLLPQRPTRPFPVPSPSPFMAFRSALASTSGLKLSTGRTVPFSCEKQKEPQQVSGGPPRGPGQERSMQGRGSFPHELQTKQLGGKEAGVNAQQTDPCPRAEKGRGARDRPRPGSQASAGGASFLPQESALSQLHWGLPSPHQNPALSPRPSCLFKSPSP